VAEDKVNTSAPKKKGGSKTQLVLRRQELIFGVAGEIVWGREKEGLDNAKEMRVWGSFRSSLGLGCSAPAGPACVQQIKRAQGRSRVFI